MKAATGLAGRCSECAPDKTSQHGKAAYRRSAAPAVRAVPRAKSMNFVAITKVNFKLKCLYTGGYKMPDDVRSKLVLIRGICGEKKFDDCFNS
jgi:hypothetical protein